MNFSQLLKNGSHSCYMKYISNSHNETEEIGFTLGKTLKDNSILCFFGDLGAGKTTFIKGLVSACASIEADLVNSPTFVYLNIYEGTKTVYHFDLYRLENAKDFLQMGYDEYLYAGGISCIEWSEKIEDIIPEECMRVNIEHISKEKRLINIT